MRVHSLYFSLISGFFVILGISIAGAETYSSGHQALEVWDDAAMNNAPQILKNWLTFMLMCFAVGLAFVWHKVTARWVVGGFILSILTLVFGIPALGLTPLSGLVALAHLVFWSPGLFMLLKERAFFKGVSFYGIWAGVMTLVILISFVFDIRDAAIYLGYVLG